MPDIDRKSRVLHQRYASSRGLGLSIVYLTNKLRRVPDSGGARRDAELLSRLCKDFDVHVVAVTTGFDEERCSLVPAPVDCASATIIGADPVETHAGIPDRIAEHASSIASDVITDLVRRYDIALVHVNGYFLMQHVADHLAVPIVLQEENIEFELAKNRDHVETGANRNIRHALYGKNLELAMWNRAVQCIAVAEEDAQCMRRYLPKERVHCLPNGVDRLSEEPCHWQRGDGPGNGVFVGNYAWPPSRDAVGFIQSDLLPAVRARFPAAEIRLAGSGADDALVERIRATPGLDYIGRYDRFEDLILPGTVFLSPLRFGGGNKMKMVEALNCGLPIVATPESLRGFPLSVRRAVNVCESVPAFADATARLLCDAALRARFAEAAVKAARDLPAWDDIADAVGRLWRREMRRGRGNSASKERLDGARV